jgi:ferredoxin-nitrite reductase
MGFNPLTKKGGKTLNWLCEPNTCPGLFYGTTAQDGFLLRLRTPGGVISLPQGKAIASLLENSEKNIIQVTNRANLQIRGLKTAPSPAIYQQLQQVSLASKNPQLDHFRNIMASPTVGIDPQELIDTRPLIGEILDYLENYPEIGELSPKFSIALDGGGQVAIGTRSPVTWEHRYNEIQLSAVTIKDQVYFHLALGGDKQLWNTDILIKPEKTISLLQALITVYLDYVRNNQTGKKLRLKQIIQDGNISPYLEQVKARIKPDLLVNQINLIPSLPYHHLGIQPQKQENYSYIGISLPLGQITLPQWQGILQLITEFGSKEIRLTPWQSILLPNIPTKQIEIVLSQLDHLGLVYTQNSLEAAIIACAGKPHCGSAITSTQNHGIMLINYLKEQKNLTKPLNIHLTACPKSCAQPSPAEITLLGTMIEQQEKMVEGYKIYRGNQELIAELPFLDVLPVVEKLIETDNFEPIKHD